MEIKIGFIFDQHYKLVKELGQGGFAVVWLAEDTRLKIKDNAGNSVYPLVALKILGGKNGVDSSGINQFFSEFDEFYKFKKLKHDNLLTANYYGVYNNRPYLIFDYCENGSLRNLLYPENGNNAQRLRLHTIKMHIAWTEEKIREVLLQITKGIVYLHDKEIVHSDLKPDNILVDNEGAFVISDFGVSTSLKSSFRQSIKDENELKGYTVDYASPEMLKKRKAAKPCDIFSLGVILFELCQKDVPWPGIGGNAINTSTPPLELDENYSKELQTLMQACTAFVPEKRPTAKMILDFLEGKTTIFPIAEKAGIPYTGRNKSQKKLWKTLSGIVALIILLLTGYSWMKGEKTTLPVKKTITFFTNRNCNAIITDHKGNTIKKGNLNATTAADFEAELDSAMSYTFEFVSLTTPFERIDTHYVVNGDALFVAQFNKTVKVDGAASTITPPVSMDKDSLAWAKAKHTHTLQSYNQYLNENPKGKYSVEAKNFITLLTPKTPLSVNTEKEDSNPKSAINLPQAIAQLQNNMVSVAGGTFTMGCTSEQGSDCEDDEKPAHTVTLSSFKIGRYEVTQAQWQAVMGTNPSEFGNCDQCPVENVSWRDIQVFIQELNSLTGKTYRLPTEAEWEYAARGGNQSSGYKYSGSNNIDKVAWYDENSYNKTHPVGKKSPNELGLYDMSGNVWEWCNDWIDENYYSSSPAQNPRGPANGDYRVLRGCSWQNAGWQCRVSIRAGDIAYVRDNACGFRLAQD